MIVNFCGWRCGGGVSPTPAICYRLAQVVGKSQQELDVIRTKRKTACFGIIVHPLVRRSALQPLSCGSGMRLLTPLNIRRLQSQFNCSEDMRVSIIQTGQDV